MPALRKSPRKGAANTYYSYPESDNLNQGVKQANRSADGMEPNREWPQRGKMHRSVKKNAASSRNQQNSSERVRFR